MRSSNFAAPRTPGEHLLDPTRGEGTRASARKCEANRQARTTSSSNPSGACLLAFAGCVARHPGASDRGLQAGPPDAGSWTAIPGDALCLHRRGGLPGAATSKRRGVQILHNHIAENSATVAMYSSMLSGIPFSMTVHGPGIFFQPRLWAPGREGPAFGLHGLQSRTFCKSQCMLFAPEEAWSRLHVVRCAVGKSFESAAMTPGTGRNLAWSSWVDCVRRKDCPSSSRQ